MIYTTVLTDNETKQFWHHYFSSCSHKVDLGLFCEGLVKANNEFFINNHITVLILVKIIKSELGMESNWITCEQLEIKSRSKGLLGWLQKIVDSYKHELDTNFNNNYNSISN